MARDSVGWGAVHRSRPRCATGKARAVRLALKVAIDAIVEDADAACVLDGPTTAGAFRRARAVRAEWDSNPRHED